MKLYYNPLDGRIFYAVWDVDLSKFEHTTNIPLSVFEIDELEENKTLCIDLVKKLEKKNENDERKYYIQNNELHERDNWIEKDGEL